MSFAAEYLKAAHKRSLHHEEEVNRSIECGCFYCLSTYRPQAITDWTDELPRTAICPNCMVDAVIGDASGYPIHDPDFLKAMRDYWFNPPE